MAVAGLYRRELPSPPAIEFASPDGKVRYNTHNNSPPLLLSLSVCVCVELNEGFGGSVNVNFIVMQKLFTEALGNGTMEGFFKLISYYQTQSEPAYCGLGTLAVVLNALAIDPGRKWKGN